MSIYDLVTNSGSIRVKTKGGLAISDSPQMSGGGTQPKPPHAPAKKPGKKPKK